MDQFGGLLPLVLLANRQRRQQRQKAGFTTLGKP
jgi:hypothetical protein